MKFEDMDVWKASARLTVSVYREFANSKEFSFKDQITRAGLSIPSNIAEGFGRSTDRDRRNFLIYARGFMRRIQVPDLYRYEGRHYLARISHQDHGSRRRIRVRKRRSGAKSVAIATV